MLDIHGKLIDMRTKRDPLAHLRSIEILRDLPERPLRDLASRIDEITVPAGTVLIHQGHLNHHAYLVGSGALRVDVDGERVATVAAGSIVGERTAVAHGPANATVTAIEPTTVHIVDHRALLGTAAADPAFAAVLEDLAALRANQAA